jgi:VWFA-related protein
MHKRTCLLLFVAAGAAAQQQPATPTFRAGARLVEVDVVARAKDVPASGLTKEDFTLLDNGKPQEISVFSVKGSPSLVPPGALNANLSSLPVRLPPGTFSNRVNREEEGLKTSTVLLVDRTNTAYTDQVYAVQRVLKFLSTSKAHDRIAIYTFGRDGFEAVQDLTSDPALLSSAAASLHAKDPGHICGGGLEERAAAECTRQEIFGRVLDTKHALEAVARHLTDVPGRKNLVWITSSLPLMGKDFDFTSYIEDAARTLNDANVALYAVDARGLIGALQGMTAIQNAEFRGNPNAAQAQSRKLGVGPSGIETMNLLAGRTGGDVYYNTNGLEDSIQTAVDDGELTYSLGFYPESVADGVWHNIKVEISRPGVSARYRKNYFAARPQDAPSDRPTMEQLVKEPLNSTQLELLAEMTPDPGQPGRLHVKVSVDPHNLQWKHENALRSGAVDVAFFVEGSAQVQTRSETFDNIPDNQFESFLGRGIRIEDTLDAAGSAKSLRIVVQDRTSGAAGSVTIPLIPSAKPAGKKKK